ncbi:MAG: SUMF1/EgtB/PvdO family nonheme iron enzyme, partial [Anaerolineae bacterium]|nr:SUMF1/EgtB/PvdO family nonheme iron enzyme [Anaerolineae bacterium]
SLSSKELRVPQVQVQPMSAEQVQHFLAAYLPTQADMIWKELDGSPQFGIFQTPYFLKLLVDQVEATSEVPAGRASLFTGFVRQALQREITGGHVLFLPDTLLTERDHRRLVNNQWRNPFDLPERGILLPSLSKLAFNMQQDANTDSGQIRLDYDDACIILAQDRDEDILKAGVALNVLDEDVTQQEILFFHQLLQEFFAARALSQKPDPELVRSPWQVHEVSPSLEEVMETLADSDPLPELPQTGWEETTLLAAAMSAAPDAFMRDLMRTNLPLAARCTAAPEVTISEALKSEIQQALIARSQDFANADLRARIAAGLALGEVGDPRFERHSGPHGDYLLPPMVDIPAGSYPMGTDDNQYDDEKPAHTVELAAFQIGKFPVTNAEYALFLAAGGYEDDQWWDTDEILAWLRGEGSTDGQKETFRELWNTLQFWSDADIRGLVSQNLITSEQADSY